MLDKKGQSGKSINNTSDDRIPKLGKHVFKTIKEYFINFTDPNP